MTVTTAVVVLPRRVAVWASRRALARNSVTGIELACALCAAVWFSAGTPLTALAGGVALGGGYLARRVGGQLTVGAFDGWLAGACALAGRAGGVRGAGGGRGAGAVPGLGPGHRGGAAARDAEGGPAVPAGPARLAEPEQDADRERPSAPCGTWPSWPAACWGCPPGSGRWSSR